VAGNEYGLFYAGEANDYAPIEAILRQHPTSIAVIDQGGDITAPRALQEKYQGRVYLCTFVQSSDVAPKWRELSGMVNVDRNKAIQLLVDEFTEKRIPLFGGEANWEQYVEHWSHLYRELEEDERGRRRYIWKRNGADHLALASVYWRVGIDRVVEGAGELITPQEGIFPTLGMELGGAIAKAHFKRF
ncbi:MAG: hypothetical protein KGJ13_10365, partial [Patescibacteria group bacterium]|nr:hypothetical protein [Patescibacteria group bacterium]